MTANNRISSVNQLQKQFQIIDSAKAINQIPSKNRERDLCYNDKNLQLGSNKNICPNDQNLREQVKNFCTPVTSLQSNPGSIQSQLKKFITLLQSGQLSLSQRSSRDMGKLSTIFSASEPESSSVDKQNLQSNNSSQSKNSSHQNQISFFSFQIMQQEKQNQLFKALQENLSFQKNKQLTSVKKMVQGLKKIVIQSEQKYIALQKEYEKQKKGTDQLLKALIQMDQAQKQLWTAYSQLNQHFKQQKSVLQDIEQENCKLKQKISTISGDNQFMKKLVVIANQNYQKMDEKCKILQSKIQQLEYNKLNIQLNIQNQTLQKVSIKQKAITDLGQHNESKTQTDRSHYKEKQRKSSKSISSKSPNRTKNQSSCSPSLGDLTHISSNLSKDQNSLSPRKQQFDNIYRKMVMRTLKNRSKSKKQRNSQKNIFDKR